MRSIDLQFVDDLVNFIRGPGYVLDFSDKDFTEFFCAELGIDIDRPQYAINGSSKGKRLRYFLQTCDDVTAARVLAALWEHRADHINRVGTNDSTSNTETRFNDLINRLRNDRAAPSTKPTPGKASHRQLAKIKLDLLEVASLSPQTRGYAFENFLKSLFDHSGLDAREPFRVRGEQIDGSFQLGSDTYLLEAKWISQPIGVGELHTFHGKIEQKSAWARGLFVSNSGFTEDGLYAFGRGKRVICMDGLDLYDMLDREIPLIRVLESKVRRAAETGSPFVRVRDIFSS